MHPNPAFRQTPSDQNMAFAATRGFGTLSVNGPDGPLMAHVPFHLTTGRDGAQVAGLHLARSNPIARAPLPMAAVIAVAGPDAYISPDWYGACDQVPTWNYLAVHLRGTLHPLHAPALPAHLAELSARFEAGLAPKTPWTMDKMTPDALDRMMRMILPFELRLSDVQGTWKLNQNKSPDMRRGAITALAAQGGMAADIARLMAGQMTDEAG